MFIKGLASFQLVISDHTIEIEKELVSNIQLRAWESILKLLVKSDGPKKLFDPVFSNSIIKFIDTNLEQKDFDFIQEYINFIGRLIAALLLKLPKINERDKFGE